MSKAKGNIAEDRATIYLGELGFQIIERNFFAKKLGEIDIIAKKDNILHFVEVKSGAGEPIYNITPSKLSKIIRSAEYYLQKHSLAGAYQIDALIIKDNSLDKTIEFIENITL